MGICSRQDLRIGASFELFVLKVSEQDPRPCRGAAECVSVAGYISESQWPSTRILIQGTCSEWYAETHAHLELLLR